MAKYGCYYGYNGGRDKRAWAKEEEAVLVDTLMELHVSGKYVNADIEDEYVNAVLGLIDPKVVYSAKPLKNRMKLLKTHFDIVHGMLAGKHMSGFSWDAQNLRVVADDQVWNEYIKTHANAAKFRDRSFPHYDKLRIIFGKDKSRSVQENGVAGEGVVEKNSVQENCVAGEGVVEENPVNLCVESKDLHVDEDAGSTHAVREGASCKRKRDEGNDLSEACVESMEKLKNIVESFVQSFIVKLETGGNAGINAANDMMDKVMTQMGNLTGLTLDERLIAMSVIGRSAPLAKMFDRLDVGGKLRMAQMVANGSIR